MGETGLEETPGERALPLGLRHDALLHGEGVAMARRGRILTRVVLLAMLCLASLHFAAPARAKTLTVCPTGCDFATIAAAIQAAADGDTISIGEGTYAGGVEIRKDVTLQGVGRDKTTILGAGQAAVIRVGTWANVVIQAVTITGGSGSRTRSGDTGGGGILNEGKLDLLDSIVRENAVTGGAGGGIYSSSSKPLTIRDSIIQGNQAENGGGIFLRGGDVEIEDTAITGNRSAQTGGGVRYEGGGTLRLERCDISKNTADFSAGGVVSSSELVIVDSTVSGNTAVNVGGLDGGRELLKLIGSTISGNVSRGSGGGIRVGSGGLSLIDTTVEKNRTRANGAGIFITGLSGNVSLKDSTITDNVADQDGGGILNDSSEIDLNHSKVIDNRAGRHGGGISSRTVRKGLVKLRNGSAIAGNHPDQCYPKDLKC
jgi:hypothetical protein